MTAPKAELQQPRQIGAPVAKHGRRQKKGFAATTAALTLWGTPLAKGRAA